jgi:hypothetical protein
MSFENQPIKNTQSFEIGKEKYIDLVNDFGVFISLNAIKLEDQIIAGKENELKKLKQALRKNIINGLSYNDFICKNANNLTDPTVSQTLISKIYEFLIYIEPRLSIFKNDSLWVTRFKVIKQKYIDLVSIKS